MKREKNENSYYTRTKTTQTLLTPSLHVLLHTRKLGPRTLVVPLRDLKQNKKSGTETLRNNTKFQFRNLVFQKKDLEFLPEIFDFDRNTWLDFSMKISFSHFADI